MPTLAAARHYEEAREALRLADWQKRARATVHSGMGPGPFIAATAEEIDRRTARVAAAAEEWAASPAGRFCRAMNLLMKDAAERGDVELGDAAARGHACYSRGLSGERELAAKILDEIEVYADVSEARAALADI